MGLCGAKLTDEQKEELRLSRELDKKNQMQADIEAAKIKLLLLGAGESGKSTIFKQMKILYGVGFDEASRLDMNPVIYNNVIVAMRTLIEEAGKLKVPIVDNALAQKFMSTVSTEAAIDEEMGKKIKALWEDEGIQTTYHRRAEFQLFDSAGDFLNSIDRIAAPGYIASQSDVLKSRVRTSGIVEEPYKIDGVDFVMYDVGGQRNERKKWIHCFENVTAVIFVAALSEYDQVLYEDNSQNRMIEAVELFDEICNARWFLETSMILFLNKKDLFEKKMKKVDIRREPAFEGDKGMFLDYLDGMCVCGGGYPSEEDCTCGAQDAGKEYFKYMFLSRNTQYEKTVYDHITCATDTSNVHHVFSACKDIILNNNLKGSGFV